MCSRLFNHLSTCFGINKRHFAERIVVVKHMIHDILRSLIQNAIVLHQGFYTTLSFKKFTMGEKKHSVQLKHNSKIFFSGALNNKRIPAWF